eukprot:1181631-Prorocentrum_minimum.AAC.4
MTSNISAIHMTLFQRRIGCLSSRTCRCPWNPLVQENSKLAKAEVTALLSRLEEGQTRSMVSTVAEVKKIYTAEVGAPPPSHIRPSSATTRKAPAMAGNRSRPVSARPTSLSSNPAPRMFMMLPEDINAAVKGSWGRARANQVSLNCLALVRFRVMQRGIKAAAAAERTHSPELEDASSNPAQKQVRPQSAPVRAKPKPKPRPAWEDGGGSHTTHRNPAASTIKTPWKTEDFAQASKTRRPVETLHMPAKTGVSSFLHHDQLPCPSLRHFFRAFDIT